jgi:hypothetical protein
VSSARSDGGGPPDRAPRPARVAPRLATAARRPRRAPARPATRGRRPADRPCRPQRGTAREARDVRRAVGEGARKLVDARRPTASGERRADHDARPSMAVGRLVADVRCPAAAARCGRAREMIASREWPSLPEKRRKSDALGPRTAAPAWRWPRATSSRGRQPLHYRREVRPLLHAESANVADASREPRNRHQGVDGAEEDAHVLVFNRVEAALYPTEAVPVDEYGADLSVGPGDVSRSMSTHLSQVEVEREGVHLLGRRIGQHIA